MKYQVQFNCTKYSVQFNCTMRQIPTYNKLQVHFSSSSLTQTWKFWLHSLLTRQWENRHSFIASGNVNWHNAYERHFGKKILITNTYSLLLSSSTSVECILHLHVVKINNIIHCNVVYKRKGLKCSIINRDWIRKNCSTAIYAPIKNSEETVYTYTSEKCTVNWTKQIGKKMGRRQTFV